MNSRFFDSTSTSPHDDAELDTLVQSLMDRYNVHAVGYALIDNYKIKRVKTINNMTSEAPSLFQAASFSKSITAFAVLDLISQYKIKLDLSINAFMHSWKIEGSPFNDLITVRHCLNMTSGLCFGDPGTSLSRYSREAQVPKLLDILCGKAPATNPPVKVVFEPGSQYYYSGASYTVLQQLIEDIVELPFETYMNNIILPKLGMNNSFFECPLSDDKHAQVIPGYKHDGTQIEGGWNNIVYSASGGMWSCQIDIANFMLHITDLYETNNDVINEMLSKGLNTDYGLGFVINGHDDSLNFRKNGNNAGYHNEFIMFPKCGKGAVIMTNSASGMELINELVAYASQKLLWPEYKSDFNEIVSSPTKK